MKIVKELNRQEILANEAINKKGMIVQVYNTQVAILRDTHNPLKEEVTAFCELTNNDRMNSATPRETFKERFVKDLIKGASEYYFFESLSDFCKTALEKGWRF